MKYSLIFIATGVLIILGIAMIPSETTMQQTASYNFTKLVSSNSDAHQKNASAINTLEEFNALNLGIFSSIDFTKKTVIVVFAGEKQTGGYSVEVTEINETNNQIIVSVMSISPGNDCMTTQSLTYPYTIIVADKILKPVKFEYSETTKNCSIEMSCASDADCSCGKNIATGACAFGNKNYINSSEQCPDFCSGIAANLEIKCSNNICTQKQTLEFSCRASGGNVTTGMACKSASDFPNSCLIGPFGCSPDNSHEVKACDCGSKCWNGTSCGCDAMRCPIPLIYVNNGSIEAYCDYNEQCATRTVCDSGYMLANEGCELINSTVEGKACIASNGTVTQGMACKSVDSFPNTCAIGSQGCSLENSHAVSVCNCPIEQCWNGNACISIENSML